MSECICICCGLWLSKLWYWCSTRLLDCSIVICIHEHNHAWPHPPSYEFWRGFYVNVYGIIVEREEGLETRVRVYCMGMLNMVSWLYQSLRIMQFSYTSEGCIRFRTWCTSRRVTRGSEAKRRKNRAAFLNRIVGASWIGLVGLSCNLYTV